MAAQSLNQELKALELSFLAEAATESKERL